MFNSADTRYNAPPMYKLIFFIVAIMLSEADAFFKNNDATAPLNVIITSTI